MAVQTRNIIVSLDNPLGRCWFVSKDGNDINSGRSTAKPKLTLASVLAVPGFGTQAGDTIILGPGTWAETLDLRTLASVSMIGAGADETIIVSTANTRQAVTLKPARRTYLRDLQLKNTSNAHISNDCAALMAGDVRPGTDTTLPTSMYAIDVLDVQDCVLWATGAACWLFGVKQLLRIARTRTRSAEYGIYNNGGASTYGDGSASGSSYDSGAVILEDLDVLAYGHTACAASGVALSDAGSGVNLMGSNLRGAVQVRRCRIAVTSNPTGEPGDPCTALLVESGAVVSIEDVSMTVVQQEAASLAFGVLAISYSTILLRNCDITTSGGANQYDLYIDDGDGAGKIYHAATLFDAGKVYDGGSASNIVAL